MPNSLNELKQIQLWINYINVVIITFIHYYIMRVYTLIHAINLFL